MERYAPSAKDLASRDVVSRSMTIEIREGRGVGENKDHIYLHLDHLDPKILHERLPGITEIGEDLRRRRPDPAADPGHCRPSTTIWAASRRTYHGEVVTLKDGNPDAVVPGLFAVGEAACVSVHGANRLGSNSLIDLVVFGRAAGLRLAETIKPNTRQADLPKDSAELALARLDHFRFAKGGIRPTEIRTEMQRNMQAHCAVFRTDELMQEGVAKIAETYGRMADIGTSPTAPDLEHRPGRDAGARQPDRPGDRHHPRRRQPQGKPRRPRAQRARISRARRQELDEAHAALPGSTAGAAEGGWQVIRTVPSFLGHRRARGTDRIPVTGSTLHARLAVRQRSPL
jgi:hypothetical protein